MVDQRPGGRHGLPHDEFQGHWTVIGPEPVSLHGYGTIVWVLVSLHVGALILWLVLLSFSRYQKQRRGPAPTWMKKALH
eukprot:CAMPEP_0177761240 /NCGR_PEP_ID=MMETSP0491_2-20121128/5699_1 /TAXON_ID=63592 /ORGANISM="Tetraselmis chuii, Strain PLY429" /LENGTH=78 /DNA_ID=CAMNT_0019277201 /DNA_START=535 /DNA_END=771 /DNA_ORIENTATION=-